MSFTSDNSGQCQQGNFRLLRSVHRSCDHALVAPLNPDISYFACTNFRNRGVPFGIRQADRGTAFSVKARFVLGGGRLVRAEVSRGG